MHAILVERRAHFPFDIPGCQTVEVREFIARPELVRARRAKIINLSRDYSYLGYGYYCSLLAEARKQKVVPSVETILELRERSIYRYALPELDELLRQSVKRAPDLPASPFALFVFFGRAADDRFRDLGRRAFDRFGCPILRLNVSPENNWQIAAIKPAAMEDLTPDQVRQFETALGGYTRATWRSPKAQKAPGKYSLAILWNPQESLPPSDLRTLQKFIKIGEQMGIDAELVERKDYATLAEFDALFIRETTTIDNHTYRFAKKAEKEGMPVIDDPTSILRCTNKVYLAELLKANRIPTPKTLLVDRGRLQAIEQEIAYPIVLKIPDGSFSRGVIKAHNRQELTDGAMRLLKESDVILAQQYIYTEFDWRIGILRGEALFVCHYLMADGHWQIVKHDSGGGFQEGQTHTFGVERAPAEIVQLAVKAAGLIGDGFYGVDIKQTPQGLYLIEVNDNPNIEIGCEDLVLGDELYRKILGEFVRRLEERPVSAVPALPGFGPEPMPPVNGNSANIAPPIEQANPTPDGAAASPASTAESAATPAAVPPVSTALGARVQEGLG